jgi:thymidine kinase
MCKFQSKHVVAFKPFIDERYSSNEIVTHSGLRWPARVVRTGDEMIERLLADATQPDVVALDEAFMLSGAADALIWLYRQGVSVVVSTLDMSSKCVPFPEVTKMMPWATEIRKCSAVCTLCGADAYYSHRKTIDPDDDVWVGGLDIYDPRCLRCHPFAGNS